MTIFSVIWGRNSFKCFVLKPGFLGPCWVLPYSCLFHPTSLQKKSPFHFLFLYKESDPKNFHVTNDVIGLSTTNLPSPGSVYLEIQLLILVKAVPPSCQSIAANYFWRANCYVVENEYADLGPPLYQRSHPTLQALNANFYNFRLSLFI